MSGANAAGDAPLVLHLNGPPGVGKSTLARRWTDAHPGTLLLEPDAMRTWVSGWREDFVGTGGPVREAVLAVVTAWALTGHDLVLPQLIAGAAELDRFEAAAVAGGARFVEVFLDAAADDLAGRLRSRPLDQPWLRAVHLVIAAAPPHHVEQYVARLDALARTRAHAVRLTTRSGDVTAAYERLVEALGSPGPA